MYSLSLSGLHFQNYRLLGTHKTESAKSFSFANDDRKLILHSLQDRKTNAPPMQFI